MSRKQKNGPKQYLTVTAYPLQKLCLGMKQERPKNNFVNKRRDLNVGNNNTH